MHRDYTPLTQTMSTEKPYEIVVMGDVASPEDCLRGLVHIACTSMANQLHTALTIISEKYGHSREELSLLLRDDPRFSKTLSDQLQFVPSTPASIPNQPVATLKTKKGKKVIIKTPNQ